MSGVTQESLSVETLYSEYHGWLETLASHPEQETQSAEQQTAAIEALIEVDAMLSRLPGPVSQAFIQSMVHGLSISQ